MSFWKKPLTPFQCKTTSFHLGRKKTYLHSALLCRNELHWSGRLLSFDIDSRIEIICLKDGLFFESASQHWCISSAKLLGQLLGMVNLSFFSTTSQATCNPSKPLKGTSLVSISQRTTPYEYVSHVSDTGRLWITSGAIHGNVPTNDMCVVWEWKDRKSVV